MDSFWPGTSVHIESTAWCVLPEVWQKHQRAPQQWQVSEPSHLSGRWDQRQHHLWDSWLIRNAAGLLLAKSPAYETTFSSKTGRIDAGKNKDGSQYLTQRSVQWKAAGKFQKPWNHLWGAGLWRGSGWPAHSGQSCGIRNHRSGSSRQQSATWWEGRAAGGGREVRGEAQRKRDETMEVRRFTCSNSSIVNISFENSRISSFSNVLPKTLWKKKSAWRPSQRQGKKRYFQWSRPNLLDHLLDEWPRQGDVLSEE